MRKDGKPARRSRLGSWPDSERIAPGVKAEQRRTAADALRNLVAEIIKGERPPTADEMAELQGLRKRVR